MFHAILTIIYLAIISIIGIMIIWHLFETQKISEKITAAIMLILVLLRLFLVK